MRRGEHHGALREALIDASLALLDDKGAESVTIRAVARSAQVSHAAPANHFPDRRALLTGVAIACFETLLDQLAHARFAADGSARARIDASIEAYLAYALRHPQRYRLIWRLDMLDRNNERLTALIDRLYGELEHDVRALALKVSDSSTTIVIALSSVIHGYASMRIDGNFSAAIDEISGKPRHQAIVDALLR
ncbi:MAG: WHG domain-containing protein [Sphingopyxis sp.]|nr:WHG domain-containing protein [Sphingopyxis sp.]